MKPKYTKLKPTDHRKHIETVAILATGQKLHYVRCVDCQHWTGAECRRGRGATMPELRITLCGLYEPQDGGIK